MKENQGNGAIPAPPEGFTLDKPKEIPPPPSGFVLDKPAGPPKKAGGFGGIASEVGKMLYDLPTQAAGAAAQAYEGAEPYTNTDWADELVQKARTRHQERLAEPYADQPLPFGLTRKDFRDTGASLGFTGVSALSGLAAGVPAGIAATPAVGYAAGGAASGAAAYRMAGNSFVRSVIEAEDEERLAAGKEPLTDSEKKNRQSEIQSQADEYGLWEAIPEAVGNVAGLKVIATPLKRMLGKNVATRVMSKLGGLYGTELATETITQMGQNNVEAQLDKEREQRSFTDPAAYWESLKEVAPQVFILTTLMGGAGAAGVAGYRRAVEDPAKVNAIKDAASDPDQFRFVPDEQLNTIIGEGRRLAKRRKNDEDLQAAVGAMEFERKRRDEKMAAGYPGTEGFTVDELTPGEEIDASIAGMPATGVPAPFPGTGGFQVDEIPATDMGDVTLQSPSPIQKMADRLRQRVTGMQRASAFRQAEQGAATQREAEMGLLARDAMRERETPSLQGLAGRVRQRLPDILGEAARRQREREEAQVPETPPTEGIQAEEAFPAPANPAMAEALRRAGAAPAAAEEPAEIRPKSGQPYASEASARNVLKIRKDIQGKGYQPVEVEGGWVLRLGPATPTSTPAPATPVATPTAAEGAGDQVTTPAAAAADTTPQETVSEPAMVAGPATEAEKRASEMRNFDDFKSWARGRYGRADYQRMLETGELNDIWNKVRGKTDAETVRGDQGQVPGEGREGEGLQDQGREGGEQPTPEGRQTTDAGAQEEAAVAFAPTHELPDGTMVRAVEDQDGVYIDADGQEYEEPNATEIFRQSQTGGDWKQVQGARTEKKELPVQAGADSRGDQYEVMYTLIRDQVTGTVRIRRSHKYADEDQANVGELYENRNGYEVWGQPDVDQQSIEFENEQDAMKYLAENESYQATEVTDAQQVQAAETPAAAPAAEEGVTKKEKGRSTRLGLNADAEEVFEDENGVRYVVKNGIRISQKVAMRPTRAGVERVPVDDPRFDVAMKLKTITVNRREGTVSEQSDKTTEPTIDAAANEAATSPTNDMPQPTEGQKSAGNYKVGRVNLHGLEISIENPKGSKRTGTDKDGEQWEQTMRHHYGYIRGSVGKDKDHVDIFIGPEAQREQPKVFVVDQIDPTTGAFDEHKVMFGFLNEVAARQGYLSNYAKGWKGIGAITPMSLDEFKAWVFDKAKTKKPAGRIERRKDSARRKRVDQMSEAEMRRELLTDELTGLGNRRAYNEDLESEVKAEFHAYMDVDALKWVNDNMGHANGDELLKMMGEAIRQGVDTTSEDGFVRGYHLSGDEFVILAKSAGMAERAAQLAQQAGQSAVLEYTAPDGTKITKTGVEFSYGIAQDLKAADEALQRNKTERERLGLRAARGAVPAGVVTQPAEGGQAEVQGVEEVAEAENPKWDTQTVQTAVYMDALSDPRVLNAAANTPDNFRTELTGVLAEKIISGMTDEARGGDSQAAKAYEQLLDGASLREDLFDDAFFEAAMAEAAKRKARADREEAKRKAAGQLETAYAEALDVYNPERDWNDEQTVAFKLGWNHAIDGKTASNLPTADVDSQDVEYLRKGYDAGAAWLQSDDGQALLSGGGKKIEGIGDRLRRIREIRRMRREQGNVGLILDEQIKAILKETARADVFAINPAGKTPGTVRLLEDLRSQMLTFREVVGEKYNGSAGSRGPSLNEAIYYWVFNGEAIDYYGSFNAGQEALERSIAEPGAQDRIAELAEAAADYVEKVSAIAGLFNGSRDVESAVATLKGELQKVAPFKIGSEKSGNWRYFKHPFRGFMGATFEDGHALRYASQMEARYLSDQKTESSSNSKKPLRRPRFDRVKRDGMKDYRGGADVTPDKMRETFGFTTITIGDSVTSKQRQDHLNYGYDSLMDLAVRLGTDPKNMSFGGRLAFSIGALGHGRHAAHFSAAHPITDEKGNVTGYTPVINVTNTKGDGTVSHEWGHALDYFLREAEYGSITDSRQVPYIRELVHYLRIRFPQSKEAIQQRADDFLRRGSYYEGMKSKGKVAMAKHYLERSQAVYDRLIAGRSGGDQYAGVSSSSYERNAQNLGKDYWANEREMFARAFEAFIFDTLGGTDSYLVSDWVADGYVTKAKGYRGAPYPEKREREDFNDAFEQLVKDLTWKDGLPQLQFKKTILSKGASQAHDWTQEVIDALPADDAELARQIADETAKKKSAEEAERERQIRAELEEARAQLQQGAEAAASGVASELGDLSADDLSDIFDEALAEEQEAQQESETDSATAEVAEPSKSAGDKRLIDALVKRGFTTPMDWRQLFGMADASYGGTQAQGAYTPKDAYDALEVAVNTWITNTQLTIRPDTKSAKDARRDIQALNEFDSNLPTQTKRTEEQDEFQQFSTPHSHAYAMAWVANLASNDVVLEPSAGTGNLATMAAMAPIDGLILNEFSERRAGLLASMELGPVYRENAEYLHSVLPADAHPTVVIMNPPFSATAGRVKGKRDTKVGGQHVEQALARLRPGGRLVALVGEGMAADRPAFRDWWSAIRKKYNVRANIGISGEAYRKFGTTFDNQILVIDKTGPTKDPGAIITGKVDQVEDLIGLLEVIRNDRTHPGQQFPAESGGQALAGPGSLPGYVVSPATGTAGTREAPADAYGDGGERGGDGVRDRETSAGETRGRNGDAGVAGRPGRGKADTGGSGRGESGGRSAAGGRTDSPAADRGKGLGDIAKDAAKHGVKGVDEALTGLFELFGGKSLKSFPGGIDQDTYAKAKPHFEKAFSEFKAAGQSIKEFFRFLIRNFGAGIKPYAVFFVQEKQAELANADTPSTPREQDAQYEALEKAKPETANGELTDSVFESYTPAVSLPNAKPHPGRLVESAAMAAVRAPDVSYVPSLPRSLIEGGQISDAQIEQIIMAGAAHQQKLPDGKRRGYFVGDGTGVGKAREIVGIMYDNMRQGRKRHIWVTKNDKLLKQAIKDWTRVTGQDGQAVIKSLKNWKPGDKIALDEGVLFVTYGTLIGGQRVTKKSGDGAKEGKSRLEQILEWAGEDFDGVVAFDEAHAMKQSVEVKGARGKMKQSHTAASGIELQDKMPDARLVYVSATGATEVYNLGYATRLGLWGEGTAFANAPDFVSKVDAGGVAAMELVAQNLKSMGLYGARSLSYDDVTYGQMKHDLSQDQLRDYDTIARSWQIILQNIDATIEITGAEDTRAKMNAMSAFWGSHQRFFNQILTSMQMPSLLNDIERQIDEGNAVVLQLVNTNAAQTERAVAQQAAKGADIDELDITPRQIVMQYLENSFPTTQYEEYTDEEGNTKKRPAVDSNGNPIQNAEAVAMRDKLLDELALISIPEGALDQIINHFGPNKVAEITGRSRRFVRDKSGKLKEERRNKSSIDADASAFMDDRKQILVFSDAGGTGQDFHADLDRKNQRKRIHYLVQPGWRADAAVQGFGRTHRSNQKQAPHYVLVTTNLKGHLRFVSSIARRLDQLGALTKGQRQTGSQGIFTAEHNLETPYSGEALYNYVKSLRSQGEQTVGVSLETFEETMGLKVRDNEGNITVSTIPTIGQFLNRLLSLEVGLQNEVFDGFFQALQEVVDYHVEAGDFDSGIENIEAQSVEIADEQVAHTDERTGAQTTYFALNLTDPTNPMSWAELLDTLEQTKSLGDVFFARNTRSGRVYAFRKTVDRTDRKTGKVVQQYRRLYPGGWNTIDKQAVIQYEYGDGRRQFKPTWEPLTMQEAAEPWQKDYEDTPKTKTHKVHMITGAILPVWDRFGDSLMKVKRAQTDDGRRLIGVTLPTDSVDDVLKRLGVAKSGEQLTTDQMFSAIKQGSTLKLVNGWSIKAARVADEQRIELVMPTYEKSKWMNILRDKGIFSERINFDMRLFIPTNRAASILADLTKSYPVSEIMGDKAAFSRSPAPEASTPLDVGTVKQIADKIVGAGGLSGGVRVHTVATEADLPADIQAQAAREGATGQVVAVHQGRDIYLVAARHHSPARVEESILHEGSHYGAKQLLRGDQQRAYRKLWFTLGGVKGLRELGAKLGFKMDSYIDTAADLLQKGQMTTDQRATYLVDEFLAHAQGQKAYESLPAKAARAIREFWGAIKAMLRSGGFAELPNYTESDLAYLLRNIHKAARGRPVSVTGMRQAMFMRAAPDGNRGTFDPTNPDIRFSRRSPEPQSEFHDLNRKIREEDRTLWNKAKRMLARQLTPGGLLPSSVFKAKIERDSKFEVAELDTKNLVAHLDDAVKGAYGMTFSRLPDETKTLLNRALGGSIDASIPEAVKVEIVKMRQYIDRLSVEYADILFNEATRLAAAGREEGAAAKAGLLETIAGNIGTYVHRSYKAFDDPKWPTHVPDEVLDAARRYLRDQYEEKAAQYDEWAAKAIDRGDTDKADRHTATAQALRNPMRAEQTINTILKEGTAFDSMESMIRETKLGAKDLSVLIRRKKIAPEIRALLGEYTDPRINFAKSAAKMSRLIFNQRFLDKVQEMGLGEFLFTAEDRPPEAWKKIAAAGNEAYAPLDGYYTYPEIEQAFRDALGKENMADWYRTVIQINGMVKYGKTVLSPTTAARNWMSAFFFAMANGHFDMRQAKKSISSLREYFTHKGAGLEYLKHLKDLGVVYDTPYAGEMMRLLEESRIEDRLMGDKQASVKQVLDYATKFYQFGDDFWKIIGFENEKALLMKHKGLSLQEAEVQAAERIRNTYPTYSMTGRFINTLRRFPLAGTFVSFPSEIIRTSYHIMRYLKQDMADPSLRGLALRRVAGLSIASGFAYAAQALAMSMLGVGDDEEEAFRDLAAPWQRNSNIIPIDRDEKGHLRFIDLSFLDPYNYWKRPINAILRDQPYEEIAKEIAREAFTPFFGTDIMAGAISEAIANKKATGGRIFNPSDDPVSQLGDILNHVRKAAQPGIASNVERTYKALEGQISPSGKKYDLGDEGLALLGWRVSTYDPKASLYYKSFEFQQQKTDATSILTSVARDPNQISKSQLKSAYERAVQVRERAYGEMARLVQAARASGLSERDIAASLRNSGISQIDTFSLMKGVTPPWRPSERTLRGAIKKSEVLFGEEVRGEFKRRQIELLELERGRRQ